MSAVDQPPSPVGVTTLDELCARLQALRLWAGVPSFSRLAQGIGVQRRARGLPDRECHPGRVTVFECFRPGRRRIDVDLLIDIVTVLGVDEAGRAHWRHAHRVVSEPVAGAPSGAPAGDGWPASQAGAVARLCGALESARPGHVINVIGPVGIGKSTVLGLVPGDVVRVDLAGADGPAVLGRALADHDRPVLVDDADSPTALTGMWRGWRPDRPAVVVATRRALTTCSDTPTPLLRGLVSVAVPPWSDEEIDRLAERLGVAEPRARQAIAHLAGGVPLVAEQLCRAVHRGAPVDSPGALADDAVTELAARLRRERPAWTDAEPVALLAGYGLADHELLTGVDVADLTELSVVQRTADGIAVREPYRTLFDSARRWRTPLAHRRTTAHAMIHHRAVISGSPDVDERSRRAEQTLWLAGDPAIRAALFPTRAEPTPVRTSTEADGDDILELLRRSSRPDDLDARRRERALVPLLTGGPDGFRVAVGPDGDITAAINALPMTSCTHALVEPRVRQLLDGVEEGGLFVGMALSRDRQSMATLLHDVLQHGIRAGRVVVATQQPAYARLANRLGFVHRGSVEGEGARGPDLEIHSIRLAPDELTPWLARVAASGLPVGDLGRHSWLTAQIRWALDHWHDPSTLATSPLLASPFTPTVAALRAELAESIAILAADPDPERAAAGRALAQAYLTRRAVGGDLSTNPPSEPLRLGLAAVENAFLHGPESSGPRRSVPER